MLLIQKLFLNYLKKKRIEMPVCDSVYKILYKKNKIKETIEKILTRDIKKKINK